MKKNITINLAGQLFAIDEDAYGLLLNYTESLRRYYRRQAEGEEVVDDIEARIAELFSELNAQGFHAITIEHVQDIIQRIGRLEDITDGGDSTEHGAHAEGGNSDHLGAAGAAQAMGEGVRGAWNKVRSGKRFYRDSENKMLAGVLAGFSRYFGGDVVIWRVIFLLLLFAPIPFFSNFFNGLSGFCFWGYVILAIIAPSASTPEERLKMRGETVNPQNLADEVNRESTASTSNEARAQRRHTISVICAVLLILFSVWLWLALLGVICGSGVLMFIPEFISSNMFGYVTGPQFFAADSVVTSILYILISVLVCLFVLAYCSMHTGLTLLGKVKAMSFKERIIWLLVWIISVVSITLSGVNCAAKIKAYENDYPKVYVVEPGLEYDETGADSTETAAPAAEDQAAQNTPNPDIQHAPSAGQNNNATQAPNVGANAPAAPRSYKTPATPAATADSVAHN